MRKILGNQRGEVVTAVLIAVALGSLLVGLVLPKLNPFKAFERTAANKKASWTRQTEKSTPVLLTDKAGKAIATGTATERIYDTGIEQSVPAPTLGQRIGSFFFGLTTWGLLAVLASLLFFGGAPLVWLARKYFVIRQALKNTVVGIRQADAETFEKLKPALEANHDKRDKVVIDKIKAELH